MPREDIAVPRQNIDAIEEPSGPDYELSWFDNILGFDWES